MNQFDRRGNPKTSRLSRRAFLLGGAQMGLMGLLGWRMHQLGVDQSEQYRLLAEENRVNIRLLPPARGLIYDRDGEPLTINSRVYTIEMVREQAKDPEKILRRLQQLVPLTDQEIDRALSEMSKRRAFVPVTVATGLEWEHVAAVSSNAPSLPGITPQLGLNRQYPSGADFGHIVGYVGPVSDYDLSKTDDQDPLLLIPRFQIGKNGVEAELEKPLRGEAGLKRIEVNSIGRVMRELDRKEGTQGVTLQLTVSSELQNFALQRLRGQSGSVVVMDVRNGDLLAMASAPTFDPNKFVNGISNKDWKALNDPKWRPLFNKAVSGTYPPGSTFKMVVALAALADGLIKDDEDVYCPGHMEVSGRKFHCWKSAGHGKMNLREALRQSCDVYFYDIALRVGIDKITAMAQKLGLGIKPELPIPYTQDGLTPTRDWKKRKKDSDWVLGDTMNAGIGQGFVLASPLQLAIMAARIGSGTKIEPRLLNVMGSEKTEIRGSEPLDISPEHMRLIKGGMFDVTNHTRGTAFKSRLKGDEKMAGKTGTSQVRFITKSERKLGVVKNEDLPWERRDHALFVAYAPVNNPKYAISVVIEHGGGGSKVAAPIARDVMERALELDSGSYGDLPKQKREQSQSTRGGEARKT